MVALVLARAHEPRHPCRAVDDVPGLVRRLARLLVDANLEQNIAGQQLAFDLAPLAAANLNLLLSGHQHESLVRHPFLGRARLIRRQFNELIFSIHVADPQVQRVPDSVLVTRVRVDREPGSIRFLNPLERDRRLGITFVPLLAPQKRSDRGGLLLDRTIQAQLDQRLGRGRVDLRLGRLRFRLDAQRPRSGQDLLQLSFCRGNLAAAEPGPTRFCV